MTSRAVVTFLSLAGFFSAIVYVATSRNEQVAGTVTLKGAPWVKDCPPDAMSAAANRLAVNPQESQSGLQEMLPQPTLAAAIQEAKQEVRFEARMLIDAGVAQDVATSMLAAAESHWTMYQQLNKAGLSPDGKKSMDYFFATWPDLGDLIARKSVPMQVSPAPAGARISGGAISYTLDRTRKMLTAILQTNSWTIALTFDGSSGPRNLFEAVLQQ